VIVLLVNAVPDVPDFRASALISSAVTKLVPDLYCDIASLLGEIETAENKIKQIRDGHKARITVTEPMKT
jgi:predicted ATP-grasp superfamily ATP-dependent carboligase